MTDREQQQNETVTTTTTQSNLHKLFSVQDVISPIPMHDLPLQQLKDKMSNILLWVGGGGTSACSMTVVPWCCNTWDCKWKDMSKLVCIGNSPHVYIRLHR